MNYLLSLSQQPPVVVARTATVLEAVRAMSASRVGAVGIVENDELVGIFTERDVMEKVVLRALDPAVVPMDQVMTSPVQSVAPDDSAEHALRIMVERHIRHLPITDGSRKILGMLSIRNLLQNALEKTQGEADALEAYLSADGPGG